MQRYVSNAWDLKERNWLQAEKKSGWSSNWDTKVNEVNTPLNQTLCILVKLTQDLRPHFQSVFYFIFSKMYALWQVVPIWDLWAWLCGKLGLLFSCWPQPHHSTPPEQHQSLQESLQKSFYCITPTQHIFHHCRAYLHQCALILH